MRLPSRGELLVYALVAVVTRATLPGSRWPAWRRPGWLLCLSRHQRNILLEVIAGELAEELDADGLTLRDRDRVALETIARRLGGAT